MARRKQIDALPAEIRQELDARLVANSFGNYQALADWLSSLGLSISKSALHRHGQSLESQYDEAMKDARVFLALTRASGEIGDSGSEIAAGAAAVMQTDLLRTALEIRRETDPATRVGLLAKLTKAQADIGRMTVTVQKYRDEITARTEAAAEAASRIAHKGGLSSTSAAELRKLILGIAQ